MIKNYLQTKLQRLRRTSSGFWKQGQPY